jgi:hypothetical protein
MIKSTQIEVQVATGAWVSQKLTPLVCLDPSRQCLALCFLTRPVQSSCWCLNCHAVGRRLAPSGKHNAILSIVSWSPFNIWSACSLSMSTLKSFQSGSLIASCRHRVSGSDVALWASSACSSPRNDASESASGQIAKKASSSEGTSCAVDLVISAENQHLDWALDRFPSSVGLPERRHPIQ